MPRSCLTARQWQVIQLVALGLTHAEIALELQISPRTVSHTVESACDRLGARNAAHACLLALGGRLVDQHPE
jgi:DNA-binding NarL/FixJ family response regulator